MVPTITDQEENKLLMMLMALALHPLLKRKVPFLQGTVQNFIGLATCKYLQLWFPLFFGCAIKQRIPSPKWEQGLGLPVDNNFLLRLCDH